ncbi:MAG: lysylphosphatidylglycerol synthase transmembrane domain-containing protein [Vampirovibrionia bacterium]
MKKYLRLIGILLFVFIFSKVNFGDVVQSLLQADWYLLSLVALLNLLVVLFRAVRWVKLLEIQNYSFGLPEAFWSYLRSLYLGNVTPGRVGELSRVHYLMKYININSAVATSGVIYDRILDTYFVLILGVLGLVMSDVWAQYLWLKIMLISFMFIIPVVFFVPNFSLSMASFLPNMWNLKEKVSGWLEHFFDAIKAFLTWKVLPSVVITFFIYFIFFVQCILLAYAMNLHIDMFYLIFCVVVFSALSVLPISVSNMGTREFSLIFMFSYVGITSEVAVTYSLLFFITINILLALFGWLAYLFYKDKSVDLENQIQV